MLDSTAPQSREVRQSKPSSRCTPGAGDGDATPPPTRWPARCPGPGPAGRSSHRVVRPPSARMKTSATKPELLGEQRVVQVDGRAVDRRAPGRCPGTAAATACPSRRDSRTAIRASSRTSDAIAEGALRGVDRGPSALDQRRSAGRHAQRGEHLDGRLRPVERVEVQARRALGEQLARSSGPRAPCRPPGPPPGRPATACSSSARSAGIALAGQLDGSASAGRRR